MSHLRLVSTNAKVSESVIYLSGKLYDIKKQALDIRDKENRWAFINFDHIKQDILSIDDILHMNNCVIFLENFETLSDELKEIVEDYELSNPIYELAPVIVIATVK